MWVKKVFHFKGKKNANKGPARVAGWFLPRIFTYRHLAKRHSAKWHLEDGNLARHIFGSHTHTHTHTQDFVRYTHIFDIWPTDNWPNDIWQAHIYQTDTDIWTTDTSIWQIFTDIWPTDNLSTDADIWLTDIWPTDIWPTDNWPRDTVIWLTDADIWLGEIWPTNNWPTYI